MSKFLFVFTVLLIFCCPAHSQSVAILDLTQLQNHPLTLKNHLEILEDAQQEWDIADITSPALQQRFQAIDQVSMNFGLTSSAYWARFTVSNPSFDIVDWVLEMRYAVLDDLQLYEIQANGQYKVYRVGDTIPFQSRTVHHPNFIFPLRAEAYQMRTYYLRFASTGTVDVPLTVYTTQNFIEYDSAFFLVYGVYFGIMFGILCYNLFLWVSIRTASYFYYVLFITTIILAILAWKGIAFQYFWPDWIWWANRATMFFLTLSIVFGTQFCRFYLQTPQRLLTYDWLLHIFLYLGILSTVGSLFLDYALALKVTILVVMVFPVVVMASGIASWWQGYQPAKFYLLAWSAFLLALVVMALKSYGILPSHFITEWALQIGSAIEVILLSLGLANHFHEMRVEKEAIAKGKEVAEATAIAKSEFLATMSHEIRTPMNGVIGMTGLLMDTPLSKEQSEYVDTIRISGEALLTIINDILDFSKIESGKMSLEEQPFELRQCIEETYDLLAPKARDKKLDLVYYIEPDVPEFVMGDITRLRQILVNLVGNAVKFTKQGEIFIKVNSAAFNIDNAIATLAFTVRDSGIGIPKERLHRLFQPFSQVDSSTTREYGGTGLGLAICNRLCTLMGGEISVKSVVGQGSTFEFTIQVGVVNMSSSKRLQLIPNLAGKKILLVDDNDTNLRILSLQLQQWGINPTTTQSAKAALTCLAEGNRYDLAILDMHMPETNGMQLALQIKQRYADLNMPLVMLSSVGKPDDERADEVFFACVAKPIRQSQLLDILTSVLNSQSQHRNTTKTLPKLDLDATLAERLPLRLLLAEDNAVNQKLAVLVLKKMGYHTDVAHNGVEVLKQLALKPYDIILMDVQMPEMDGLEATRRIINGSVKLHGGRRPKIIAMTANAMQGDRERCLQAGMDDYITKPIKLEMVQETLEKWGETILSHNDLPEINLPILDEETFGGLQLIAEDEPEMFIEIIDSYIDQSGPLLSTMRDSLGTQDGAALREAAHSLKGASWNIGAAAVGELSRLLEEKGKNGDFNQVEAMVGQLEHLYQETELALQAVKG